VHSCTGTTPHPRRTLCIASVLQCVAVCCRVWLCVAVCCSVLQCVAVCRSMLSPTDTHGQNPPKSALYGVATISRLLKIIGLFCKRALQKRPISSKETCNSKEPTNHSHPIALVHTPKIHTRTHARTHTHTHTYTDT